MRTKVLREALKAARLKREAALEAARVKRVKTQAEAGWAEWAEEVRVAQEEEDRLIVLADFSITLTGFFNDEEERA